MMPNARDRPTRKPRPADAPRMTPNLNQYLARWLTDIVKPALEPLTYAYYETMARLYISPALGSVRLDRLQTHDVQNWLNKLTSTCQCCAQGKDAGRQEGRRHCCAVGACCESYPSHRTIQAARDTLRAALNHAKADDEMVSRNVASYARVPDPPSRGRRRPAGGVEQASQILASARDNGDPLHAAYLLVLVNALRKGEVLGLTWSDVDLDSGEMEIRWQLQRVGTQLIHKQRAKTEDSDSCETLPIPDLCSAALKLRREEQAVARDRAGDYWQNSDLVFTTRWGTPIEPRNFNRSFDSRCAKAGVPHIPLRDARHTCVPLLAALGVHPSIAIRILRHAHIPMTAEAYTEVAAESTRAALQKFADSLHGTPPAQRDQP
jgi:integrase